MYYDPGEVEAYVKEATATIKALQGRLQEEVRRADQAEAALGDYHPESAGLGRALLLAGEVADKTISDADAKASEILESAKVEAGAIVERGRHEAHELVSKAKLEAAAEYRKGEERLMAAVNAFVRGVDVLRGELATIAGETSPPADPPTETVETIDRERSLPQPPPPPATPSAGRPPSVPFTPRPVADRDELRVVLPSHAIDVAPFVPPSFPGGADRRA
jgi:hypothetical protein